MTRLRTLFVVVLVLLVDGLCLSTGTTWAASGDISSAPSHLVSKSGALGRSTISWSTSGLPTAQVWASVNGGSERLVGQGASGSRLVSWIQPGYTVFSLYGGTSHRNLLDYTSVTTQPPPRSSFGFNYWPSHSTNASTLGANWGWKRPIVETDLDHIASIGGTVVRFMIWPSADPSAWKISAGQGGSFDNEQLTAETTNIVDLIRLCRERGLRVIVAFGNPYIVTKESSSDLFWWQWAYGSDWQGFRQDALRWVNRYVKKIEASPYRSTVIAYDYQNELSQKTSRGWQYLRYLYDNSVIPRGKRAVSMLQVPGDAVALKNALGKRHLDYVDYHSYPAQQLNANIEQAYDSVAQQLPDSTVILGEFGRSTNSDTEPAQSETVTNLISRARAKGVPYFLHWMLWDITPPGSLVQKYGLGYRPDRPKDALGAVLGLTALVPNSDMEHEDIVTGRPIGWSGAGTVPFTLRARGSLFGSATNSGYARLKVTSIPGSAWLSSKKFAVRGGQQLFANAYIRSNMSAVRLVETEYDDDAADPNKPLRQTDGPLFTPSGWSWNNYLESVGPWGVELDPRTDRVVVSVWGSAASNNPSLMDVDAVSAATR